MLHHASFCRCEVETDGDGEIERLPLVVAAAAVIDSGSLCSDAAWNKGGVSWLPSWPLVRPPAAEPAIGTVIVCCDLSSCQSSLSALDTPRQTARPSRNLLDGRLFTTLKLSLKTSSRIRVELS